jgi:hypothetical protein
LIQLGLKKHTVMQKIDQLLLTTQLSIAHPFEKGLNGVQI